MNVKYNAKGLALIDEMVKLHPKPILLEGRTGFGKSRIARTVAERVAASLLVDFGPDGFDITATNAHPGMDIALWVGQWLPQPNKQALPTVQWQHGVMTNAIERGYMMLLEELSRAPQDAFARIFPLLDNGFRGWPLPEAGIKEVAVHNNFWFVATANPAGEGYATTRLDPALRSRFYIFDVNEPIADELALLQDILPADDYPEFAGALHRFVLDCRRNTSSYVNTRDILLAAEAIACGFTPQRAVEIAIAPKYTALDQGVSELAAAHFEYLDRERTQHVQAIADTINQRAVA